MFPITKNYFGTPLKTEIKDRISQFRVSYRNDTSADKILNDLETFIEQDYQKDINNKITKFRERNFQDTEKVAKEALDEILGILDDLEIVILEDQDFKTLTNLKEEIKGYTAANNKYSELERKIKDLETIVEEKINLNLFDTNKKNTFLEKALEELRSLKRNKEDTYYVKTYANLDIFLEQAAKVKGSDFRFYIGTKTSPKSKDFY